MTSHDDIPVIVARLDERLNSLTNAFTEMAEDQRRLTDSFEKLVESNQRMMLLEADMVTVKESTKKLWDKWEEEKKEKAKAASHVIFEMLKLIALVTVSVMASHLGIKLIGG